MAFALVAAQAPSGAEETGISGTVESIVELSLAQPAPGRVVATVTATVDHTRVSVSEPGRSPRVLRSFQGPTAQAKVTVHATGTGTGTGTEQTITFGPQGP
jgi:hypothetical protein